MYLKTIYMKKLFIFALIIAAFASCKRKQTLRELGSDQTLAEYPVTTAMSALPRISSPEI